MQETWSGEHGAMKNCCPEVGVGLGLTILERNRNIVHELTKATGSARPQRQTDFLLGDSAPLSLGAGVPTIGPCCLQTGSLIGQGSGSMPG